MHTLFSPLPQTFSLVGEENEDKEGVRLWSCIPNHELSTYSYMYFNYLHYSIFSQWYIHLLSSFLSFVYPYRNLSIRISRDSYRIAVPLSTSSQASRPIDRTIHIHPESIVHWWLSTFRQYLPMQLYHPRPIRHYRVEVALLVLERRNQLRWQWQRDPKTRWNQTHNRLRQKVGTMQFGQVPMTIQVPSSCA